MPKLKTTKAIRVNKLLAALGGKMVNVALKYNKTLESNPVISAILLDEDYSHYYLGEGLAISIAVRKVEVQMILDAAVHASFDEPEVKPFGTKVQ